MRFKDFINEEQSGTDGGMMGYGVSSKETQGRAPSDGQPFADQLKSTAGARPQPGMGGGGMNGGMNPMAAGGAFMKKMKKKMKKR